MTLSTSEDTVKVVVQLIDDGISLVRFSGQLQHVITESIVT